jgi:predicted transcriptional regulator
MINVKELKLKKIFNLKEYLQEKARRDKEYEEYVNASIQRGLQDIKEGRIEPLDKVLRELEEEFGLEHYE